MSKKTKKPPTSAQIAYEASPYRNCDECLFVTLRDKGIQTLRGFFCSEKCRATYGAKELKAMTAWREEIAKDLDAFSDYEGSETYNPTVADPLAGSVVPEADAELLAWAKTPDAVQWYEIEVLERLIRRASVRTKHGIVELSIGEHTESPITSKEVEELGCTEFRFNHKGHRYRVERPSLMLKDTAVRWAHGFADAIVEGSIEVAEEY